MEIERPSLLGFLLGCLIAVGLMYAAVFIAHVISMVIR